MFKFHFYKYYSSNAHIPKRYIYFFFNKNCNSYSGENAEAARKSSLDPRRGVKVLANSRFPLSFRTNRFGAICEGPVGGGGGLLRKGFWPRQKQPARVRRPPSALFGVGKKEKWLCSPWCDFECGGKAQMATSSQGSCLTIVRVLSGAVFWPSNPPPECISWHECAALPKFGRACVLGAFAARCTSRKRHFFALRCACLVSLCTPRCMRTVHSRKTTPSRTLVSQHACESCLQSMPPATAFCAMYLLCRGTRSMRIQFGFF